VTGPPTRGYPDAATFATPARLRLAASARALVDAVVTALGVPDAELEETAAGVDALVEGLRARADTDGPAAGAMVAPGPRRHGDFVPRSPFVGVANPISPPFDFELRDGRLHARGVFTAAFEGPPGYVHGGWVALAFDEILGLANAVAGHPGMTGRLTIRYRRPTPLRREVRFTGWVEHVEGRRIVTRATLEADGTTTAEAEGLFVQPTAERRREYFGDQAAYED
jgi:acyl-coenzyme A thioesterase PaaI-like protein